MFKSNFLCGAAAFLFGALLLVSCSEVADLDEDLDAVATDKVELTVKTLTSDESDFSLTKELLRTTAYPSETSCKYVVVMVYDEANMDNSDYIPATTKLSQPEGDEINSFSVELERGHSYRLCVLASDKEPILSDEGSVGFEQLSGSIYWASSQLSIPMNAPTHKTLQMTLGRVVAAVKIKAKDSYPVPVTATLTHDGFSSTLDMLTGFGVPEDEPYVHVIESFGKYVSAGGVLTHFSFVNNLTPLSYNGQECYNLGDVSLTIKDGETTVGYMAYENVPANRNQQSVLSGLIFSLSNEMVFSINGDWGEEISVDF